MLVFFSTLKHREFLAQTFPSISFLAAPQLVSQKVYATKKFMLSFRSLKTLIFRGGASPSALPTTSLNKKGETTLSHGLLQGAAPRGRQFHFILAVLENLVSRSKLSLFYLNQGGHGSVRLRFGGGTVRAVPVFGSGGSSPKKGLPLFQYNLTGKDGSGFGSWKTVPAVPVPLSETPNDDKNNF